MWLFAKHGFFSIVEHRADPRNLLVRARVKGDIEHYFLDAKVTQTDAADYLYRAAETAGGHSQECPGLRSLRDAYNCRVHSCPNKSFTAASCIALTPRSTPRVARVRVPALNVPSCFCNSPSLVSLLRWRLVVSRGISR